MRRVGTKKGNVASAVESAGRRSVPPQAKACALRHAVAAGSGRCRRRSRCGRQQQYKALVTLYSYDTAFAVAVTTSVTSPSTPSMSSSSFSRLSFLPSRYHGRTVYAPPSSFPAASHAKAEAKSSINHEDIHGKVQEVPGSKARRKKVRYIRSSMAARAAQNKCYRQKTIQA